MKITAVDGKYARLVMCSGVHTKQPSDIVMIFTGKPPAEQNYQIQQEVERTVVTFCEDRKYRYRMQKPAFQHKTPCYLSPKQLHR